MSVILYNHADWCIFMHQLIRKHGQHDIGGKNEKNS